MINFLLPLLVLFPLCGAFLVVLIPDKKYRIADFLTPAITLGLLVIAIQLELSVTGGSAQIYQVGGWLPPIGIFLNLDPLSGLVLVAVNILGFTAAVYGLDYLRHYSAAHRFQSLFLILMAGMNGVVISGDIFNIYVFLEITSIASYALVAFGIKAEELEAGFKYAVMGIIGSSFILLGIALLYGLFGTLNLAHLQSLAVQTRAPELGAVFGLLLTGFLLKAAAVPFHTWLPDAHSSAPASISALLSGAVVKVLGVYLAVRIFFSVFYTPAQNSFLIIMRLCGGLSMVLGAVMALAQKDLKRIFAYSTISQVGYILLAFGLGTPLGIVAGSFHLFNHAVSKSLLFFNAGAVEEQTGSRDVETLRGLGETMPQTAALGTVGALSTAGMPPFAGFWSKLLIIIASFQAGFSGYGTAALLTSILTLSYFVILQQRIFWEKPKDMPAQKRTETGPFMRTAMLILALITIGGGVLFMPTLRNRFFDSVSRTILPNPTSLISVEIRTGVPVRDGRTGVPVRDGRTGVSPVGVSDTGGAQP